MMILTRKSREFSHSIEELQGFQEELHTLNMEMVAWAESWEQCFTESKLSLACKLVSRLTADRPTSSKPSTISLRSHPYT